MQNQTASTDPNRDPGKTYDDYAPACRTGYTGHAGSEGKDLRQAEPALRDSWEKTKGASRLTWEKTRQASRPAWERVGRAVPGDSDGDGR